MEKINLGMLPEERLRLLESLPPSTPLSIARAAWFAGYRSTSTLKTAMAHDRLHVERHGPRVVTTTAGDLLAYLRSLTSEGARRGQPRKTEKEKDQ